jgi:hypothetical protein
MKVEIRTKDDTDYVSDRVTFEDDGDYVEISYYTQNFRVRKSDLKKVIALFTKEEQQNG